MKQTLLLILLAAMIPTLSMCGTCIVLGENFECADSVVFYDEVFCRMDTCRVTDGHFRLKCKKTSQIILSITVLPNSQNESADSVIRFYIVPDSRHITAVSDSCVRILGSGMSSDINAILDTYDSFCKESNTMEEAYEIIRTIYGSHTNDIVGAQAFILSWMMDVEMLNLIKMYNEGGRFIRDNGACNICWRSFNEDLSMFGQPINKIKKNNNGRYDLSNVMTFEECTGIIDNSPDDYFKVWKAIGTLHLFYPKHSLTYETRLAENGNAVACMCMVKSLLAGDMQKEYTQWTDEELQAVLSSLRKCAEQRIDDFAKEYCCLMAHQIYTDSRHFDEDSSYYYYEKAKSIRDVIPKKKHEEWLTYAIPAPKKRNSMPFVDIDSDAVDLGLSVKWRNRNLGADSISDSGYLYAWGDVEAMEDNLGLSNDDEWKTYKWCDGRKDGLFRYCTSVFDGNAVDCRVEMLLQDDAASSVLGGRWRTPTISEWEELLNPENCSWEWTCVDGMNGYRVTSRLPGFTESSIFLPAPNKNELFDHSTRDEYDGCDPYCHPLLRYQSDVGRYWSSSLFIVCPNASYSVGLARKDAKIMGYPRSCGLSIRPILP